MKVLSHGRIMGEVIERVFYGSTKKASLTPLLQTIKKIPSSSVWERELCCGRCQCTGIVVSFPLHPSFPEISDTHKARWMNGYSVIFECARN